MENNMDDLIASKNISKRELSKFKYILDNYQPNNTVLISLLTQHMYRNIDKMTLMMLSKTIDALFKSLEYPTEEWEIKNEKELDGYRLVRDSIIEYCTTNITDVNIILDNVAFINNKTITDVKNNMQIYMSNYGDTSKIVRVFKMYNQSEELNLRKAIFPEGYIPIFSRAVLLKIKEIQNNKQK